MTPSQDGQAQGRGGSSSGPSFQPGWASPRPRRTRRQQALPARSGQLREASGWESKRLRQDKRPDITAHLYLDTSLLTLSLLNYMGQHGALATEHRRLGTQLRILYALYLSASPCVSRIARIRAARNNTLSVGAYVTLVHAVSNALCALM